MSNPKNLLMPINFITDVMKLLAYLDDYELGTEIETLSTRIGNEIQTKIQKLEQRENYTKSKTAETEEEREKARNAYLDNKGIHQDWRW